MFFLHSDSEKSISSQRMMYYLNDGVYGSVSCLLYDPAHTEVKPYLHRVNILFIFLHRGPTVYS